MRDAVANGLAIALCERVADFGTPGVVFHRRGIRLRIGKHQAVGGDHRDSDAARRYLRNPVKQSRAIYGGGRNGRERRRLRRICKRDARNGSELFESGAFVVAPQRTLGIEIDGEQDRDQQGEKSETEFPEKIKPHGFRTNTPRPGRSSSTGGSPDRIRFFHASGGRKRPRCAE